MTQSSSEYIAKLLRSSLPPPPPSVSAKHHPSSALPSPPLQPLVLLESLHLSRDSIYSARGNNTRSSISIALLFDRVHPLSHRVIQVTTTLFGAQTYTRPVAYTSCGLARYSQSLGTHVPSAVSLRRRVARIGALIGPLQAAKLLEIVSRAVEKLTGGRVLFSGGQTGSRLSTANARYQSGGRPGIADRRVCFRDCLRIYSSL